MNGQTLRFAWGVILLVGVPAWRTTAATENAPITLELTPVVTQAAAEMRVVEHIPATAYDPNQPLTLAFATLESSYHRTTDQVERFAAKDESGPLPFAKPKRQGDDDIWVATRPSRGSVTIRYAVPAASTTVAHRGPITYLQHSTGGLSGAFASFLLAPNSDKERDYVVTWHLPAGDRAVTNRGIGGFRQRITRDDLASTLFVAGRLVTSPRAMSDHELLVAGLNRPQIQVDRARGWFMQAYSAMRGAFGAIGSDGYRIMFFSHDRQGFDSGTSNPGGFLYFIPTTMRLDSRQNHSIIAHEIVHSLAPVYGTTSDGDGDWFTEGLADYAAISVPAAKGLYSPSETLDLINQEAATYYLNPLRNTPNDQIAAVKWNRANAWSLGYSRGALYFANLDALLRDTGGKATVFSLMRQLKAAASDEDIAPAQWERLLRRFAGARAVEQWQDMLAGRLIEPMPGAFGPCFVAHRFDAGFYDIGIYQASLAKGAVLTNVLPGSAAERAGLRNGDVLREAVAEQHLVDHFDAKAVVKVLRNGKPLDVVYLPRKGEAPAYRWAARSGDPARPCGS